MFSIRQSLNTPQKNISILADFFRVVRCLGNFSLVTKRTKHVSIVREVIRRWEKICTDDILTLLMTSHTQKVKSWFLDSNFWAKLQISWPGWSADRSIKILLLFYSNFVLCVSWRHPPWRRRLQQPPSHLPGWRIPSQIPKRHHLKFASHAPSPIRSWTCKT